MVYGRVANSLMLTRPGKRENSYTLESVAVFRLLIIHPGPQCACSEKVLWE
jgi:hypothetical protein